MNSRVLRRTTCVALLGGVVVFGWISAGSAFAQTPDADAKAKADAQAKSDAQAKADTAEQEKAAARAKESREARATIQKSGREMKKDDAALIAKRKAAGEAGAPAPTVVLKPGEKPAIQFDTPVYDFGRVRAGGDDIEHDFWFTNVGNGPLEILSVKPS